MTLNEEMNLEELNSLMNSQPAQAISTEKLDEMILTMQETWEKYEEAKKVASKLFQEYESQETDVINTLKAINKSKYFVDGLGNVSVTTKYSFKIPASLEAKEELFNYIREAHGEDVLKGMVSINSQKLNAWAKEELETKPELNIPGLDSPTPKDSLSIRKAR